MSNQRTIPSLDGLRAVAILLVILCHSQDSVPLQFRTLFVRYCGSLGVDIFFVISGFLITSLLLKEFDRTGQIDFRRFYVRRSFRIFPPFYIYLAVVAVLRVYDHSLFTWTSFASAAAYVWNYNPHVQGWTLGHSWSLSMEEQFYLFWPALLMLLRKKAALRFSAAVIALSPAIRVATYALFPALRGHIDTMLHTHLDTMMVGCFLALAINTGSCGRLLNECCRARWALTSALILVLAVPPLEQRFRGAFYLLVGISMISIGCGIILLYSIRNAGSVVGRVLNLAWVRHIGVISYSLYLWQQLFTGERSRWFPFNLLLVVACAELSYWLVEQPSFRLRDWLAERRRVSNPSMGQPELLGGRVSG